MAEKQTAAATAAPLELVTITVAARRTIHAPGEGGEDGEPAVTVYGPGQKLKVDPAEARRLRAAGFADPERPAEADPADQAEA